MLTKEEIDLLKSDPKTAALGAKLESDPGIPKSRFDEINQKAKEAQAALDARIEADKKAKEAADLEQGKYRELLTAREKELVAEREKLTKTEAERASLETKAKAFEESQAKIRTKHLESIKDADLRKIAEKLPSVEDVVEFAEKVNTHKIKPFNGKTASADDIPVYKNAKEWQDDLQKRGMA